MVQRRTEENSGLRYEPESAIPRPVPQNYMTCFSVELFLSWVTRQHGLLARGRA